MQRQSMSGGCGGWGGREAEGEAGLRPSREPDAGSPPPPLTLLPLMLSVSHSLSRK